jgi:cytochrome c-type biogenesis protein CcmH
MDMALMGFGLGALAAVSALLLLVSVGIDRVRPGPRSKALAGLAFALPLVALVVYTSRKPPDHGSSGTVPAMPVAAGPDFGGDDWSLVSHVMTGGASLPAAGSGGIQSSPHTVEEMAQVTAREPGNVGAWLALAAAQRRTRDFSAAVNSLRAALRLDATNVDAWADYADALASATDHRLAGEPAAALEKALKLDARHPKALWLQASLDLELKRYDAALEHWQALRAVLPAQSPDLTIVDANILEARQLLAQPAAGG